MIKAIAIAIQAIAVAGGAYVGVTLSSGSSSAPEEKAEKSAEKEKKEEKKKAKKDKKDKKAKGDKNGDDYGGDGAETTSFLKFSRQFVVPVVSRDNVSALVILDISLELDPAATESAYSREPKVRDAILKSLLQLSNEGAFGDGLLEEENLNDIRARLQAAARTILGEDLVGVLILNVARQDI